MTKKNKILACIGHLKISSIHKVVGTTDSYVRNVISENILK